MKTKQLSIKEEAARCLLCENAPCSRACGKGDVARAIRAIRFGNEAIAHKWIDGCDESDLEKAEQACIHYDRPIRIRVANRMEWYGVTTGKSFGQNQSISDRIRDSL